MRRMIEGEGRYKRINGADTNSDFQNLSMAFRLRKGGRIDGAEVDILFSINSRGRMGGG